MGTQMLVGPMNLAKTMHAPLLVSSHFCPAPEIKCILFTYLHFAFYLSLRSSPLSLSKCFLIFPFPFFDRAFKLTHRCSWQIALRGRMFGHRLSHF